MPFWSLDHRVFAYDTFVMTGGSIVNTQREFRRHFGRHDDIPTLRTIWRWVTSLRSTGKLTNKKPPGPRRSARTLENVDRVRQAIQRSPVRSARKHASELRLSDRTVRRILHVDLGLSGSNRMEPQLIWLELRWTLCEPYSIIMSSRDLAMFRSLPVCPICQHVISSSGAFLSPMCMRVSHIRLRN
jgi:hypothetical protein